MMKFLYEMPEHFEFNSYHGYEIKSSNNHSPNPEDIRAVFLSQGSRFTKLSLQFVMSGMRGYSRGSYTHERGEALAEGLSTCRGPLKHLTLYSCNIDDDGMISILTAIMENEILKSQMQTLDLTDNDITERTLEFIRDTFLPECESVYEIKLKGDKFQSNPYGRFPGRGDIRTRSSCRELVREIDGICLGRQGQEVLSENTCCQLS